MVKFPTVPTAQSPGVVIFTGIARIPTVDPGLQGLFAGETTIFAGSVLLLLKLFAGFSSGLLRVAVFVMTPAVTVLTIADAVITGKLAPTARLSALVHTNPPETILQFHPVPLGGAVSCTPAGILASLTLVIPVAFADPLFVTTKVYENGTHVVTGTAAAAV